MIPSVVASEITGAQRDFLATGFEPSSPELASVVNDFLADAENLVKGPYLSIALPFRRAPEGGEPFREVPLGFTPYRHRRTAFSRLAASAGRSTVIATSTGSGKTECFLYPVLDYCREQAAASGGRKEGIKAILIYPMNALAMDQARRIAQTIHRTPSLRGRVSAGLYVGESERTPHTAMGPDHVITDRGTLRERPPDILLTNYKMLDFPADSADRPPALAPQRPGHPALSGGGRAAHLRRRPRHRSGMPRPAASLAARSGPRATDLRRHVGHDRR